jgi:GTPase SAR1 family protein
MTPAERYKKLEEHLSQENPVLLEVLDLYRQLDKIGYRTGVLDKTDSFASKISWWPLISILGTFSAGKSSFINQYLGQPVQQTGNQAVDDKFTVICYGKNKEVTTLPGLALDADPRFPFFGISKEIEKVEEGEGAKVNNYLQLKTVNSERIKGKILIDSPGFDADAQRSSTLKITNHIIEMSDLVLVFFDARHPEPGAMRDTLNHLVETVIQRNDASKVLFILNQIDTAAKEDNPEEVISAWQRAISQQGLVSGNFFTIYNEAAAIPIEDPKLAERFKRKNAEDLQAIISRMDKVSVERSYRIIDAVAKMAEKLEKETLPKIKEALQSWRRKTLMLDGVVFGGLFALMGLAIFQFGLISQPLSEWPILGWAMQSLPNALGIAVTALVVLFAIHYFIRNKVAKWEVNRWMLIDPMVGRALAYNNRFWRGMFPKTPRGWGRRTRKGIDNIATQSKRLIQKLNDQFADPSGQKGQNQSLEKAKPAEAIESNAEALPEAEKSEAPPVEVSQK